MKNAVLALVLSLFVSFPALAADGQAPTRESLVAYWEDKTLNDPDVKQFEKTGEKGVYKFESGFFPYKGRLRLLNAAITKSSDGYLSDFYTGIIEVELADAPEDFFRKYATSYSTWAAQNYFYYDTKKSVWFPASEWGSHVAEATSGASCPAGKKRWDILLLLGLAIAVLFLAVFAKRQNDRVWKANDRAREDYRRAIKIAEDSLKHQEEHTKLLREIAASFKKK